MAVINLLDKTGFLLAAEALKRRFAGRSNPRIVAWNVEGDPRCKKTTNRGAPRVLYQRSQLRSLRSLVSSSGRFDTYLSWDSAVEQRIAKDVGSSARTLCKQLEDLYSGLDSSFMWDTSRVWELLQPTLNYDPNGRDSYEYVGRTNAERVYKSVLGMQARQRMQVLGAKGSGKSTVVSTVSGYLIGCRKKRVVYLCAKQFIEDPESCLLDALLVACGDDENIAAMLVSGLPTLKALVDYCRGEPDGSLLFVVDDWDWLETKPELEEMVLKAIRRHMLVKVSSMNSRERRIWQESDKADRKIKTEYFDGPYNSDELKTWLGQSELTEDELQGVDRLTGGIPRLLQFYEETRGNERAFLRKIKEPYTSKLFDRFIGKLGSREELRQVLDFVVSGKRSSILKGKVDLTCFYMDDDGLYHPLCPYLRSMAEFYIMVRHEILKCSLHYEDIRSWAVAVKMDCGLDGGTNPARNPARIGWNVESLVISVMRYKKKVFSFDFKYYKTYEHGGELAALEMLGEEELEDGVLMGPLVFNEKAVDAVYLKLEGTVLKIKVLHITVAQWKVKEEKQLHEVWEQQVLPRWTQGFTWEVEQEYYYIMPKTVTLSLADGAFYNASDSLSCKRLFKRLGDVDSSLSRLDDLLSLGEPAMLVKEEVKQCAGMIKTGERAGQQCKNRGPCQDGSYYCAHHLPSNVK